MSQMGLFAPQADLRHRVLAFLYIFVRTRRTPDGRAQRRSPHNNYRTRHAIANIVQ